MKTAVHIGLIGDYNAQVRAHWAIPQALALAAESLGCPVEPLWLATTSLARDGDRALSGCAALWCVPASPYISMTGALNAIRFAREQGRPFLGTCGGFQHALIEYTRNVLGWGEADHAESNPAAALPLIAPLACSLVGATGTIRFQPGSRFTEIYGRSEALEAYHCSYGFNPDYRFLLDGGPLRITGVDANGDARAVELGGHPFFLATLFQPELSALTGVVHPLVRAFVQAAAAGR